MTSLHFEHCPLEPCAYFPPTSTYIACLGCATAHETRFCDGVTTTSWKLCSKHQDVNNSESFYDEDMLQFLRESVYDGSIPKPEIQEQPMPPATQSVHGSDKSTSTSNPDIDPEIEILRSQDSNPRVFRKAAIHVLWPTPTNSYSHACSCFHNPDVRFATYTDTEDTRVPPSIKVLTSPEQFLHQHLKLTAYMARLRNESMQRWETGDFNSAIEDRLRKMSLELNTSRLGRGVFFRRCNGEYVNALGWSWEEDEAEAPYHIGAHRQACGVDNRTSDGQRNVGEMHGSREIIACARFIKNVSWDEKHSTSQSSTCVDNSAIESRNKYTSASTTSVISTNRLLARESLNASRSFYKEDLVITCWVWHQHTKRLTSSQGPSILDVVREPLSRG